MISAHCPVIFTDTSSLERLSHCWQLDFWYYVSGTSDKNLHYITFGQISYLFVPQYSIKSHRNDDNDESETESQTPLVCEFSAGTVCIICAVMYVCSMYLYYIILKARKDHTRNTYILFFMLDKFYRALWKVSAIIFCNKPSSRLPDYHPSYIKKWTAVKKILHTEFTCRWRNCIW